MYPCEPPTGALYGADRPTQTAPARCLAPVYPLHYREVALQYSVPCKVAPVLAVRNLPRTFEVPQLAPKKTVAYRSHDLQSLLIQAICQRRSI